MMTSRNVNVRFKRCSTALLFSYAVDVTNTSVKSVLGKVRGAHLPQEYELSKFAANITHHRPSWSTSTPACEWENVFCKDNIHVTGIDWSCSHLSGSLRWDFLPLTLCTLSLMDNKLTGIVELDMFPQQIVYVTLVSNFFKGTIDVEKLPHSISGLDLEYNEFEGSLNLMHLPKNMRVLHAGHNNLSGNVILLHLPPIMKSLYLSYNKFSGTLDLQHLPSEFQDLRLNVNNFSGLIFLDDLPKGLKTLWLYGNEELQGEIDARKLPETLASFSYSDTKIEILPTPQQ